MLSKYCINCGVALPNENAKFCGECGASQTNKSPEGLSFSPEMIECPQCRGRGKVGFKKCKVCTGTGRVTLQRRELYNKETSRKNMAALIFLVIIFACPIAFLVWGDDLLNVDSSLGHSEESLEKDIVGKWTGAGGCFEFNKNGTYKETSTNAVGTWKVIAGDGGLQSDTIIFTSSGGTTSAELVLTASTMILKTNEGTVVTYRATSFCP